MANNLDIKDAAAATKTVKTTDNAGVHTSHHNVDTVPADPFGMNSDAAVAAGAAGSWSAKLRSISRDIVANIVLAAGSAIIGKVGIDQTTPGTTDSVTPKATEAHLGEIGGNLVQVAATFARPANTTAYTAGDVVSDNATTTTLMSFANFARINAGKGYIVGARITTDKKSVVPRMRVHLYNASNPTMSGDNLAIKHVYADESKRIGRFDLPAMITGVDATNSDMSETSDYTIRVPFQAAAATRTIYAVLEALDAFTPASGENFSLTLIGELY